MSFPILSAQGAFGAAVFEVSIANSMVHQGRRVRRVKLLNMDGRRPLGGGAIRSRSRCSNTRGRSQAVRLSGLPSDNWRSELVGPRRSLEVPSMNEERSYAPCVALYQCRMPITGMVMIVIEQLVRAPRPEQNATRLNAPHATALCYTVSLDL